MEIAAVREAIKEAERFIQKAKKVKQMTFSNGEKSTVYTEYGSESAACKRASMDLTKALAKMRKS
ncbi:MAG: hypothetical protein PHW03_05455 [Eubacteriales bacterium]|nr:hypothetical protein [Eubacteriales bacterium]